LKATDKIKSEKPLPISYWGKIKSIYLNATKRLWALSFCFSFNPISIQGLYDKLLHWSVNSVPFPFICLYLYKLK